MAGLNPGPSPLMWRGEKARTRVGFRRRGAGGVLAEKARTRGGARPRAGRYLDGRMHLMGGVGREPHPRPLSNSWRGMDSRLGGSVAIVAGLQVVQGAGIGRVVGQVLLARPVWAGRQGDGGVRHDTQTVLTRRPGHGGWGYINTRCPRGGARTVRPRHVGRRGAGSPMTRRLLHRTRPVGNRHARRGTQTVLTRRLGRAGRGYVSTRCPRGGTRTAMPRRIG